MNIKLPYNNSSNIPFLFLTFGYFIYNFLISKMIIYPFLGGYFGNVSLFFLIYYLLTRSVNILTIELLFFLLEVYIVVIALVAFLLDIPYSNSNYMLSQTIIGVLLNLTMFFVAKNLVFSNKWGKIFIFLSICIATVVFLNIDEYNIYQPNIPNIKEEYLNYISSYQGFARSIILILFFVISVYFRKTIIILLTYIFGIIIFLFIGSRTEFAIFIMANIFLHFVQVNRKIIFNRTIVTVFSSLIIVILLFMFISLPNSRILGLGSLNNDSSWQLRTKFKEYAIRQIMENPILGNYGDYINHFEIGAYSHNLLSVWIDLGLFGFLFYVFILFYLWYFLAKNCLFRQLSAYQNMYVLSLFYTTVSFIFSKDYNFILFGFTCGIVSYIISHKK